MGKFARAVTGESLPTRSKLPPITRHAHAFTDYAGIWPRNKISALTEALDSGLRSRPYDFVMKSVGACQPGKAPDRKIIARAGSPCCSSPAAMCYWAAASLIAWGLLSLIGICWRPFRAFSATTIYLAMAAGCGANWLRNRTLHCGITAPLFLMAGLVSFLSETCVISLNTRLVWPFVVIGVGIAFLLEWRYTRPSE